MKTKLKKFNDLKQELEDIRELKVQLESKEKEVAIQIEKLPQGISQAEERLEVGLLDNVQGKLADEELEAIRRELADLKGGLNNLDDKARAIKKALGQKAIDEKRLAQSCITARHHFLLAAARDIIDSGITEEVREVIRQAWAVRSRTASSGYRDFLFIEIFPEERIEARTERWEKFVDEYGIDHYYRPDRRSGKKAQRQAKKG